MESYRQTFYQSQCHPEKFTWFDSWHFQSTVCHSLSLLIIPLQFYGGFCIFFKTPERMRHIKWALFHLHFWTAFFDIAINSFLTPVYFLPQNCFYSVGILSWFGASPFLSTFAIQCTLGMLSAALVIIFENRHNAIVMNKWKISGKWWRKLFFVLNYTSGTLLMLPPYYISEEPNQDEAKLIILKMVPCPAPDFFDPRLKIFYKDVRYYEIFAHIQFVFFMTQGLFFSIHSTYHLLNKHVIVSENTRKLQLKVFKSVCIQVTIPFVAIVIPVAYAGFSSYFVYYNQTINNILIVMLSFHGIFSTVALILVYEPYRKYTSNSIRKMIGKESVQTDSPVQPVRSLSS